MPNTILQPVKVEQSTTNNAESTEKICQSISESSMPNNNSSVTRPPASDMLSNGSSHTSTVINIDLSFFENKTNEGSSNKLRTINEAEVRAALKLQQQHPENKDKNNYLNQLLNDIYAVDEAEKAKSIVNKQSPPMNSQAKMGASNGSNRKEDDILSDKKCKF